VLRYGMRVLERQRRESITMALTDLFRLRFIEVSQPAGAHEGAQFEDGLMFHVRFSNLLELSDSDAAAAGNQHLYELLVHRQHHPLIGIAGVMPNERVHLSTQSSIYARRDHPEEVIKL